MSPCRGFLGLTLSPLSVLFVPVGWCRLLPELFLIIAQRRETRHKDPAQFSVCPQQSSAV